MQMHVRLIDYQNEHGRVSEVHQDNTLLNLAIVTKQSVINIEAGCRDSKHGWLRA